MTDDQHFLTLAERVVGDRKQLFAAPPPTDLNLVRFMASDSIKPAELAEAAYHFVWPLGADQERQATIVGTATREDLLAVMDLCAEALLSVDMSGSYAIFWRVPPEWTTSTDFQGITRHRFFCRGSYLWRSRDDVPEATLRLIDEA